MALSAGARLGPFEIVSSAGAGGMGEVSKAMTKGVAYETRCMARSVRSRHMERLRAVNPGTAGDQ